MQKNGKPVGVRAAAINGRTIVLALRDETEQMNWHDGRIAGILIAEYGSWQEAVCSNDFEEINGDQYEKIKELEKRLENLTNNYKLLEKKQAIDIADGQALVDGLDDFDNVRVWDNDSDDFVIGILDKIKENVSFKYLLLGGDYFQNCRPVRRDEVNFYDGGDDEKI